MTDTSDILVYQQGSDTNVTPAGLDTLTNALHPAQRITNRLAHFDEGVYDLTPESHLSRLLKVLLGDVGVGQLHKRLMLARLQSILGGAHFFDLDAFYGAVFGVHRRQAEQLPIDPFRQEASQEQWDQMAVRDASYRSRVEQFSKAIHGGATVAGIEAAAEAVLGVDCDVRENWTADDLATRTWSDIEDLGAWSVWENYSWETLELGGTQTPGLDRHRITVIPKRVITPEEQYEVLRVVERLRPAGSIIEVQTNPIEAFATVPISLAHSDSENWEVRSEISNSAIGGSYWPYTTEDEGFVSKPLVPWSRYQGEAWSSLMTLPSVVAFTTTSLSTTVKFDPTSQDLPSQKFTVSGDEITFLPRYALMPPQTVQAGRLVSEGILATNPYAGSRDIPLVPTFNDAGIPVRTGLSSTGSVAMDGAHLAIMEQAAPLKESVNRQSLLFWTSPVRNWNDSHIDAVEVRFSTPQYINFISAEIAAYPHKFEVQAWDEAASVWRTVFTRTIKTSTPYAISGKVQPGSLHPYHFGEGHWTSVRQSITPTLTSVLRFSFTRFRSISTKIYTPGSSGDSAAAAAVCRPPIGIRGQVVPYPTGLRNVDVGYRLTSINQVPLPLNNPAQEVVATRNALDQAVRHLITRYPAENVLDSDESFWKSQPQPVADAVVNLYLDMRASGGSPSVVDRFYLDPLTNGQNLNLYWSDAVPSDDFSQVPARDDDLFPSNVVGSVTLAESLPGLSFPPTDLAFFDFDNSSIQWDPNGRAWWLGVSMFSRLSSQEMDTATVLSWDGGSIHFDAQSVTYETATASVTVAVDFGPGVRVDLLVGSRPVAGERVLSLSAQVSGVTVTDEEIDLTPSGLQPSRFRLGGPDDAVDGDTRVFPFRLVSMNLTYGTPPAVETFMADPQRYARHPLPVERIAARDNQNTVSDPTTGAFLRFSPEYVRAGDTWGFVGGQPDIFDLISWTPIARDYVLRKGYIRVPPTLACFWKFEFTNLHPEPYETFLTINRRVKRIPTTAWTPQPGVWSSWIDSSGAVYSGSLNVALSLASGGRFRDIQAAIVPVDRYAQRLAPTTALISSDQARAALLRARLGFGFNFIQWQPGYRPIQFLQTGVHTYDVSVVTHLNKIAFFVGLRTLRASRLDYSATDDTTTYIDTFADLINVEDGTTLEFNPGVMFTTESASATLLGSPAQAESRRLGSFTGVDAVQFATQQSDAVQIIRDDTFKDPALATSTFTDSASWHILGDALALYDPIAKGVKVTRNPDVILTLLGPQGRLIHDPIEPVLSTTPLWNPTYSPSADGGLSSALTGVSAGGALHAAVRVTALTDLQQPLVLQIIGQDDSTVLNEIEFTPTKGVVTEQTLRYVLGSQPGMDASASVRLIQRGGTRDEWLIDALSLFDDSIFWEWSNDDGSSWVPAIDVRNNQDAVIRFAKPNTSLRWRVTCYRHNLVISSIKIKPWYTGKVLGRHAFPQRGPNLSIYDDDIPIQEDPDFTAWTNPIPQRWFALYSKSYTIETETLYGESTFAVTYNRTAGDTGLALDTDTADVGIIGANRIAGDEIDVAVSVATTRIFVRNASDSSLGVTETAQHVTFGTGLFHPPIDEIP